jgi:hypothetical protein
MNVNGAFVRLAHTVTRSLAIILATLKEIFDESAYTRFLERHGISSSREAYAGFLRETDAARVRRARCC